MECHTASVLERRMKTIRPFLVPILSALLITACSSTKQVPREEFEEASKLEHRVYRVQTMDASTYAVTRYSVTDSTFVIESLDKKDERFETATLPIILPLDEVQSIEMKDRREAGQILVLGAFVLVGIALVALIIDVIDGGPTLSD